LDLVDILTDPQHSFIYTVPHSPAGFTFFAA